MASLDEAQRKSYQALSTALAWSFALKRWYSLPGRTKVHSKKGDESMADFGRDIAKLVRLAYPTADSPARDVTGINVFWRHFQGMKLHVK